MDRTYPPINSLLEQAAHILRSQKETARTFEPTEGYKGGQIKELIKFANANNLWISLSNLNVEFLSKGGENEVYTGDKDDIVVKLNNFEYAGDDLENFFIRITAHNKFFGNVPYQMIRRRKRNGLPDPSVKEAARIYNGEALIDSLSPSATWPSSHRSASASLPAD